nr:unnamed protein product [Naegleria fowleri]
MLQEFKQFFSQTIQSNRLQGGVESSSVVSDQTNYAVALTYVVGVGFAAALVASYKLFKKQSKNAQKPPSDLKPSTIMIATMKDLQMLYMKEEEKSFLKPQLDPNDVLMKKPRIGVLLVNLGTPKDATPNSVYKYLKQFLMDGRVIDAHPWLRFVIVNLFIVPFRYKHSTKNYQSIWKSNDFTDDSASPLKYNTELILKQLRERVVGEQEKQQQQQQQPFDVVVEYAMRYQDPSIEVGLNKLRREHHCTHLMILPLFPQYASATVGSIHEECMRVLSQWLSIPSLNFVNSFPTYDPFIRSTVKRIEEALHNQSEEIQSKHGIDHVLVSYHSLPLHHETKGYKEREDLDFSYYAQCLQTTKAVLQQLVNAPFKLEESKGHPGTYIISEFKGEISKFFAHKVTVETTFQSRLGKLPWLSPYTTTVLEELALAKKRVLIVCPSFVTDCIETDHELMIEEREEFHSRGGDLYVLVKSVNDESIFVEGLYQMILNYGNALH